MNKKHAILAASISIAVVGVARATVEGPLARKIKTPVTNEQVVGNSKEETVFFLVKSAEPELDEIGRMVNELRDRFYRQRFGPPPKVCGLGASAVYDRRPDFVRTGFRSCL
ncbi:MAG: hypothetical protein WCO10_02345 [bacterium]